MFLIYTNDFLNRKWNYPNRKWNYLSHFRASNQKERHVAGKGKGQFFLQSMLLPGVFLFEEGVIKEDFGGGTINFPDG